MTWAEVEYNKRKCKCKRRHENTRVCTRSKMMCMHHSGTWSAFAIPTVGCVNTSYYLKNTKFEMAGCVFSVLHTTSARHIFCVFCTPAALRHTSQCGVFSYSSYVKVNLYIIKFKYFYLRDQVHSAQ
jgi:hypothetical protein